MLKKNLVLMLITVVLLFKYSHARVGTRYIGDQGSEGWNLGSQPRDQVSGCTIFVGSGTKICHGFGIKVQKCEYKNGISNEKTYLVTTLPMTRMPNVPTRIMTKIARNSCTVESRSLELPGERQNCSTELTRVRRKTFSVCWRSSMVVQFVRSSHFAHPCVTGTPEQVDPDLYKDPVLFCSCLF